MGKFSKKVMGKEVGDASTYAVPHTMDGKPMRISKTPASGPNLSRADEVTMSVGNISKAARETKTSGIKMRGTGAATKGVMSRGPMG